MTEGKNKDSDEGDDEELKEELLDTDKLQSLFAKFFWVMDNFCEVQSKDDWKQKLLNHYGNRKVRADVVKNISRLDWSAVPKPQSQEERFEF